MEIALYVLLSIIVVCQVILISFGVWAKKEDKKSNCKHDIDEDIYLLDKELWEISSKIEELQTTLKCKNNYFEHLKWEKQRQEETKASEDKEA